MNATPTQRRQRGLSIIELMVATTISVIMFAVIIELFASNKDAYRMQEGASVSNENARFAISHLQFFMRQADHWGPIQPEDVQTLTGLPAVATNCTGSVIVSNEGFRGFDGTSATPPVDCIPAADYEPNTDAFFVRYGAAHENGRTLAQVEELRGVPTLPAAAEDPIYSSYVTGVNGDGIWVSARLGLQAWLFEAADHGNLPVTNIHSDDDADDGVGMYMRYQAMLYYIRPCSNPQTGTNSAACDAGDDGVPTLVRRRLTAANPPVFQEEDIVTGVENMQLLYGVDSDADFVADRYETAAAVQLAGNWNQVVSVRVSLIVANLERDNTINDTATYYTLDDTWVPPAEARTFRRSQYEFTVQIRNMSRA